MVTVVLNCRRNHKNGKGKGEMFERNTIEVDSTSPVYELDVGLVGLENRKKFKTINCNSKP